MITDVGLGGQTGGVVGGDSVGGEGLGVGEDGGLSVPDFGVGTEKETLRWSMASVSGGIRVAGRAFGWG